MGRPRNIVIRLYSDIADHREIIEWLDSLPSDGRGVRYNERIIRVLLAHIRGIQKRGWRRKRMAETPATEMQPPSENPPDDGPENTGAPPHDIGTARPGRSGANDQAFADFAIHLMEDLNEGLDEF